MMLIYYTCITKLGLNSTMSSNLFYLLLV